MWQLLLIENVGLSSKKIISVIVITNTQIIFSLYLHNENGDLTKWQNCKSITIQAHSNITFGTAYLLKNRHDFAISFH